MWWFLYSDLDHHLPLHPPFVPLPPPVLFFHAASECICPACMKTVWGWSCCPRGSTCWRSPRRSSSAWRRWSSSVSVSLLGQISSEILERQVSKWNRAAAECSHDGRAIVWESYCCVLGLWSQCQWRVRGASVVLMNCEPPTSRSWTA